MNAPYTAADMLKVMQYNMPEEEIQRRLEANVGLVDERFARGERPSLVSKFASLLGRSVRIRHATSS